MLLTSFPSPGCQRAQAIGEPSLGSASAANIEPQVNGLQPPQTPTQHSVIGPRSTPVSKLPHRTLGPFRSLTQTSVQHALSQSSGNTQGEIIKNFLSLLEIGYSF